MPASPQRVAFYSIGTVSSLCGVDTATLRNWELRYGLLRPRRDHDGRRLYSEAEVDRVRRIIALLNSGVSIDRAAATLDSANHAAAPDDLAVFWGGLRTRLTRAVQAFDEDALQSAYAEALSLYPVRCVFRHAMMPLLQEMGSSWRERPGAIAEEHFFSVFLRNKLGARFHHRARNNDGVRLLAACMPGDQHELALLLFAHAAMERGYGVTMLGADVPLPDIGIAARRAAVRGVVLSASMDPSPVLLRELLPALIAGLDVPVFTGGPVSLANRQWFESIGGVVLGNDAEAALDRIGQVLAERP